VLGGQAVRDQAERVRGLDRLVGGLAGLVGGAGARPDLVLGELPHGLDDERLLVAGGEVDGQRLGSPVVRPAR
jgi:hypothetical protein